MKKRLLYAACSCLMMFLPIGSCYTPEYDDLKSEPLELRITGLDFQPGDDEFTLEAL